jgi:cytochrome c-type biogenesis protein CcmH
MMLIWLLIASLSGFVVLGLLWPLAQPPRVGRDINDSDFYRSQLAEIERDKARGLLDDASAEDAKTEAARKLLAASQFEDALPDPEKMASRRKLASLIALIGVPVLALSLYAKLGSPGLPDEPLAARTASINENADLSMMVAKVEARLAQFPEDGLGWGTIAPIYLSVGRYDDAIKAYANALRLMGETADLRSGLGEARMAAANGLVTAEALADFSKALERDPKNERAQYYRAMAAEQDGDKPRALKLYQALLNTIPPDSEPGQLVAARITNLNGETAKPSFDPNAEQSAMIRSMVERLDARLAGDGSDLDGWLKLMRAYQVLGDGPKAADAFTRAKTAQASNAEALAKLNAAAKDLGIAH